MSIIYLILFIVAIVKGIADYRKEKEKARQRMKEVLNQKPKASATVKTIIQKEQKSAKPESVVQKSSEEPRSARASIDAYTSLPSQNIYNNTDVEKLLARIQTDNETEAFSMDAIGDDVQTKKGIDLGLNTPEDFKRAFIHTLIFERKY